MFPSDQLATMKIFIGIYIVQPGIHFMSGSAGSPKCYRNINIINIILEDTTTEGK